MRGRAPALAGPVLAATGCLLLAAHPAEAATRAAASPAPSPATGMVYGWWTQQNAGPLGAVGTSDVPADGILVQNGGAGPLAMAAVRFDVPAGAAATLTLTVSGQAVATQPVQACPLTGAFTPAAGGAWADRPAYDCAGPVTATQPASGGPYVIQLGPLARAGQVAVAILAAGPADRIAFSKPAAQVVPAAGAPAPAPTAQPVAAPPAAGLPAPIPIPPLPLPAPPVPAPPAAAPSAAPVFALPTQAPRAAAPAAATQGDSADLRRNLGTFAATVLLVALLVYWTDAFGTLKLRWLRAPSPRPVPA